MTLCEELQLRVPTSKPWLTIKLKKDSPIGLILCSEKNQKHIELLHLDRSEIRVVEYLTELPPQPILEAKLHEAIRLARE